MNWNIVFGAQAVLASAVLYAATLWPATGEAAVLIPVANQDKEELWKWLSSEDAAIMGIDNSIVRVQVPSQSSLWRALGQGYIPVSARAAGCLPPQAATDGSNSIS